MKIILWLFLVIFTTSLMATDGATTFAKCAKCHGADGKHKAFGISGKIAGMSVNQTLTMLKSFKSMSKTDKFARVMSRQVSKLSKKDLEDVALYISNLK